MAFEPTIYVPYPWYQDGTYSSDPLKISPEGLAYGSRRRFVTWHHEYWWDGTQYVEIDEGTIAGTVGDAKLLPASPRPFGEIWKARRYVADQNKYVWDTYFWDSEHNEWKLVKWYWTVEALSKLPNPGLHLGAAHIVDEPDVEVFWDGYQYRRPRHSALDNDQPELHLPPGFIQGVTGDIGSLNTTVGGLSGDLTDLAADVSTRYGQMSRYYSPDARVVFLSPTQIGLESVKGGAGVVNVAGEWILASSACIVLNTAKAVGWNSGSSSLYQVTLAEDTDYWIYLANNQSAAFHFTDYDYRGKLFLSPTADTDDYLSDSGAAVNARLVGQVKTTHSSPPQFHRDLNLSLISRLTNFAETYRSYSDYQLVFVDESHLQMIIGYGLYGQIAINDYLYYLGGSTPTIDRTGADSNRVEWNESLDGRLELDSSDISISQLYYVYIGADIDPLNFNGINTATGRPWQSTDVGSMGNYVAALDLRLQPFLSTKAPESDMMSEEYPGYYIRHIGQVLTDANGYFVPASDISAIRQPTLNPAHFEGLAEIAINPINETEFQVCRKRGTSGIVNVAGEAIQTYEQGSPNVHRVMTTFQAQLYDEGNLTAPLSTPVESWQGPEFNMMTPMYNNCSRQLFHGMDLPADGTKIRIILRAYETVPLSYSHVSIGERTGSASAVAGAMGSSKFKEFLFGGVSGVYIAAGQSVTSDWLTFDASKACDYVFVFANLNSSAYQFPRGAMNGSESWTGIPIPPYNASAADWNLQSPSNYSGGTGQFHCISGIEISSQDSPTTIDPGQPYYIYIANSRSFWGDVACKLFASLQEPINGYLSRNWPGNNARWIATVISDAAGKFTGSYIAESAASVVVTIDDHDVSMSKVWSSERTTMLVTQLFSQISAQTAWNNQTATGLPTKLEYSVSNVVRLATVDNVERTITFPDLTTGTMPWNGIFLAITGSAATVYYVYLRRLSNGTTELYQSTTPPTDSSEKLQWSGNDILVGYFGLTSAGVLGGYWSVYSLNNQDTRTLSVAVNAATVYLGYDALVIPPIHPASFIVDGSSAYYASCYTGYGAACTAVTSSTPGSDACTAYWPGGSMLVSVSRSKSHGNTIAAGVYASASIWVQSSGGTNGNCSVPLASWVFITGSMTITIEGN